MTRRSLSAMVGAALALLPLTVIHGADQPTRVSDKGWSLEADAVAGSLSVAHARLGVLLSEVQLEIQTSQGLSPCRDWTAEQAGVDRLVIRTRQPRITWVFELRDSVLGVSCTAPGAVLIARVPVSLDRTTARLLDPEGVPVEWAGTGEVAYSYGGAITRNRSFLPLQNPDCMYFALGTVSSAVFHGLFDRATDTGIRFPPQAELRDSNGSRDRLDLTWPIAGTAEIRLSLDYFTKALGLPHYVPFDEKPFPRPPMVWCSWTSYYGDITESEVRRNAEWLAEHLKPYGFQYVQVDDGYDRSIGNGGNAGTEGHHWIDEWNREKFPHGPQALASYIRSLGLHPGLWLVPNAYAGAVGAHPDWYLRDKQGKFILDYMTPSLDSSNPAVLDFLRHLFSSLKGWGFEYYKFDGENALPKYAPPVDRTRLHDPGADPIAVYRRRLDVIRDILGPGTFVEGCPAGTPLDGIGFFNSYFNGQDAYNNWHGMYSLLSSINSNAFLNRMVVYIQPGEGLELGERLTVEQAAKMRPPAVLNTARTREDPMTGLGVTTAEARTLVSLVALTGVAYPLGGVMPDLPADRLPLLQKTMPTMAIRPVDLFSRGNDLQWDTFKHTTSDDYIHHYPEIVDLKVNAASGIYDVVGLPNWRSATVTKTVSFSKKLGLPSGTRFIVFDFWNQKLLGVFQDGMSVEVAGHDTRVLFLHPLLDRPQLIGISRHITGAYSVESVAWNSDRQTLSGSSQGVPGAAYRLWFYLPDGFTAEKARAQTGGRDLPVRLERAGNAVMVEFQGQLNPVDWSLFVSSALAASGSGPIPKPIGR